MELEKRRGANRNTSRNRSRRGSWAEDVFGSSSGTPGGGRRSTRAHEDEEALRWAALEKLPTYDRLRTTIMKSYIQSKSSAGTTTTTTTRLFKVAEEDNEKFLTKFRNRIDKVGINLPTVEVRFEHLTVQADCYIGDRALPTLPNVARNIAESALSCIGIRLAERTNLTILKNASGIIKPSRMALLLGPPSSGKTTLLLALAGKLDPGLKVQGEITYNGHRLNEFVPQKTSAYISQNDVHATAVEGVESSLITDYTLRIREISKGTEAKNWSSFLILGLDVCRDTIVGDEMIRGISGGQKKRVTT
ncbi:hypothetical protein RJ639_026103, partial [Escallonia herrerae]